MTTQPSDGRAVRTAVPAPDHEDLRVYHATADTPEGSTTGGEARTATDFATEEPTLHDLKEQVDTLKKSVAALTSLLRGVTREGRTLLFTGLNLQIVNNTKSTDGAPNGLGNLILGYNAPRTSGVVTTAADRAGSHALVIGDQHHWSSYGHIIAGFRNTVSSPSASVTGGRDNTAQGAWASVSGGRENRAAGDASSVSGGRDNRAVGGVSSVSGGGQNEAEGGASSVTGGGQNKAVGLQSSVTGGGQNRAEGLQSSVTGGVENRASNTRSSVSGGHTNQANGVFSSILGGVGVKLNTPNGCHSC
jgi:hypothetical protein